MKKALLLVALCSVAVLAVNGAASAVMTNMGEDREVIFSGHDIQYPTNGAAGILYAPSESDDPGYRAAISAACGGAIVAYFDARVGTPSVSMMQGFDCVYTWANFAYADNVTFGNNLATYVDGGGRVVLGVFCTYTSGNFLSGTIMTSGYSPVVSPLGNNHFSNSSYAGDGSTCIHNGITSYSCTFRDFLVTQGGGIIDGTYLDGEIAHAYRSDFAVIYSNGAGAFQLGCSGQWANLVCNACQCGGPISIEPETLGIIKGKFLD